MRAQRLGHRHGVCRDSRWIAASWKCSEGKVRKSRKRRNSHEGLILAEPAAVASRSKPLRVTHDLIGLPCDVRNSPLAYMPMDSEKVS